jgi:hypothetical protein
MENRESSVPFNLEKQEKEAGEELHYFDEATGMETFKNCLYEVFATFLFVLIIYFCQGKVGEFILAFS